MSLGYMLIMMASVGVGILVSRQTQRALPLRPIEKIGLGLGAFVGAMAGAKLPFLFEDWDAFFSGTAWFSNGKTILTGLVGGYLGVESAKWALQVRTRTGDSFVLPVSLAIAVGRLGCFYAGCCYGQPTDLPWGVVFHDVDSLPRHPTQLYEMLFHLLAAVGLLFLATKNLFSGQRFKLYLIAYAAFRFFTEWLRPEAQIYGGLTGYQVASLVIVLLFIWLWRRDAQLPFHAAAG